jgi:hypothetical protein
LRAALQAGCRDEPIAATNPAEIVMHSSSEGSHKRLAQRLVAVPSRRSWVDQSIAAITDRSMNRFAGAEWWYILMEWSWPFLSICAVAAGYFGHIIVGLWMGSSALAARIFRERAREVTYRRSSGDVVDVISMVLLAIVGALALQASVSAFDALFLALSLFGLTWVVLRNAATTLASQISPLTVALLLAVFGSFGQPATGFKVAIMAIVGILCIGLFAKQS